MFSWAASAVTGFLILTFVAGSSVSFLTLAAVLDHIRQRKRPARA